MPNTQIVNQPNLYVNNLNLSVASNTTLSGTSGAARDTTNTFDIVIDSTTTINAAVNGLNGLDTGSLANSTWYAVHAIGDSTNTKPSGYLLSTSATAPAFPFGYDTFRRVGWTLTNNVAQFLTFFQEGTGVHKRYFWATLISTTLSSGSTSFAAVSLAVGVPPTGTSGILEASLVPASAGNEMAFRRTGSSATSVPYISGPVVSQEIAQQITVPCNASQSIDVKTTSGSDIPSLFVVGFDDYL